MTLQHGWFYIQLLATGLAVTTIGAGGDEQPDRKSRALDTGCPYKTGQSIEYCCRDKNIGIPVTNLASS